VGFVLAQLERHQRQPESLADPADALVQAQKFESRQSGPCDEHGCHMEGVECPYRLAWKRLARAFHDLWSDTDLEFLVISG
jgi:hypothetical protein